MVERKTLSIKTGTLRKLKRAFPPMKGKESFNTYINRLAEFLHELREADIY